MATETGLTPDAEFGASVPGIPFALHAHDSVGSTSDEARALAESGAPHGTVVTAREQTGGRGRLRRVWHSPPGNLYLSAVLRPEIAPVQAPELGFVAALAVADTVAACLPAGPPPALKWPNDVLVDGAKIAGILLESDVSAGSLRWMVLGIGLNVAHSPARTPYPATSLRALNPAVPTPEALRPLLLGRLDHWWTIWLRDGFASIRAAWTDRAARPDAPMRVGLGDIEITGRFAGLGDHGALLLATDDGPRRITAGEVAFGGL